MSAQAPLKLNDEKLGRIQFDQAKTKLDLSNEHPIAELIERLTSLESQLLDAQARILQLEATQV